MADGKNISMLTCYYDITQNSTMLALGNKRIDSQEKVGLSTEAIKLQTLQTTSNDGIKNNLIVGDLNTNYFDACSEIVQEQNAYPTIKFL